MEKSLSQSHPLPEAFAQMRDGPGQVMLNACGENGLRETGLLLGLGNRSQVRHHSEIGLYGELRVEGSCFGQITDLRLDSPGVLQHIETIDGYRPLVGLQVARQNLEDGRLAGAVRAQQAHDLTRTYRERDPFQRLNGAVRF